MTDLIIGLIVVVIIGAAAVYIYKEKKKGTKCIGCPHAGQCSSHDTSAGCSCGSATTHK